jgi:hypothetical protein
MLIEVSTTNKSVLALYLWITPAGGKLWRWANIYGGKEELMSFGKYPAVTLALARDRHLEGRKLLAISIDPLAQRKAEKTVHYPQAQTPSKA